MCARPIISCRIGGTSVSELVPDPADLQRPIDELKQFCQTCEARVQRNNRRLRFLARRGTPLFFIAVFAAIFFLMGLILSLFLVINYGISPLRGEVAKIFYVLGFSATSALIGGYLGYFLSRVARKRLTLKKHRLARDLSYAERLIECHADSGAR